MNKAQALLASFTFLLLTAAYGQKKLVVKSLESPILIDGHIEPAWNIVEAISGFTQLEPQNGLSSSNKTVVRSAQFKKDLYFSIICFKRAGEQLAASIQRRDQLSSNDDIISILLDTYSDKRTALLFQVNPLGTLTDAKVTDDGKKVDFLWDTEWEAKTTVSDTTWIVEIKIPFKSVQHNSGSSEWGVNFGRVMRSNQETAWWMPVSENYRVSQGGQLVGVNAKIQNKHLLRLFPYGTLRYENSDISGKQNKFIDDGGLDLQYQYQSNLKANLTINPDFATVEGDKEQINLTPWELRFPDKRLFFQDGNEMFGTRISTFYSRRIGDMNYGGKLIGKSGKFQFNALTTSTKEDADSVPKAWFNAVRVKADVLKASTVGFTYADKIVDTASFRSFSLDYVLNLGKTWKLTGQLVSSMPGDFNSHSAWFVRFARENNIYHYHIRYSNIGTNFQDNVNQTGFIPDDDRRELDSDINYRFWINKKISYLKLSGKNNVFWSQAGRLRSWFLTYGSRMYLQNRLSFDFYYNDEYKLLEKDFHNHFYRTILGYNTDEATFFQFGYRRGKNFDKDFELFEWQTRFQLFKKLSLSYELNRILFSPDKRSESTTINILGIDYFFNKDLWIRLFAQNNLTNRKTYFYGLFGWRFKPPFGALYLIVNSDSYKDGTLNDQINSEIVFLKLTYPFTVINR